MDDPDFLRLARGAPHVSYDEMVRHPRMAEARRFYLERFLALYDRDPFMARLLIEMGRFLVYHVAVILGAAQDPARPETWLTVGRLKSAMAMFGSASDRHIDQLVARLRAVGFLTSEPSEQDRRVRIVKPTEKMLAHDRALARSALRSADRREPVQRLRRIDAGRPRVSTRQPQGGRCLPAVLRQIAGGCAGIAAVLQARRRSHGLCGAAARGNDCV